MLKNSMDPLSSLSGPGEVVSIPPRPLLLTYPAKEFKEETTAPYTPHENGVAERASHTIAGRTRCMLYDAGLAKKFWAEAFCAAIYLKNVSMTVVVAGKQPFEA
jgi:hypothetical protein